jgi:Domain of unknown function (DUF4440)
MPNDAEALEQLNVHMGEAESVGDREWLAGILAPELAFLRADGKTFDDADRFLGKVGVSDSRVTRIESIEVLGDRAIVKCIVTVKKPAGDESFHNLRLFVRIEDSWRLLAWANEPLKSA